MKWSVCVGVVSSLRWVSVKWSLCVGIVSSLGWVSVVCVCGCRVIPWVCVSVVWVCGCSVIPWVCVCGMGVWV